MKISLHVGLNRVNPDAYSGWPGNLNACISDATDFAALAARCGFQSTGLIDEDSTIARFESQIVSAAELLVAGDTFFLSYSGHGGSTPSFSELPDRETLCLFDGELADTRFRWLLGHFKPGVRFVGWMDECHAGGIDRSVRWRPRVKPEWIQSSRRQSGEPAKVVCEGLILAACTAQETASDGQFNGAFTGAGLATMAAFGEAPTWKEWFAAITRHMSRNFPEQHPQAIVIGGSTVTTGGLMSREAFA